MKKKFESIHSFKKRSFSPDNGLSGGTCCGTKTEKYGGTADLRTIFTGVIYDDPYSDWEDEGCCEQ